MTAVARSGPRRLARLSKGARSTALFVVGSLFDIYCVINVPGAAVLVWGSEPSARITNLGVVIALLAIACWGTVFVRERAPLAVIVAGGVLMLVGVSYVLALVGVYHALIRWPRKTMLIASLTALSVLLFVLRDVLTDWGGALAWTLGDESYEQQQLTANIASAVIAVCSLALVAGLVAYRRARAEASASRERAEQAHERADALDAEVARQAERERIARDLHDGLGHRLSSVALAAGAFEAQAAATVDPELTEWARVLRSQAHAALEDVRDVVGGLRSDAGADDTARAVSMRMVGSLVADLRAAGHHVDAFVVVEGIERVNPLLDAAAYRIVQGSLTNAIKHAPGATISLTIDAAPDRGIRIRVENPLAPTSDAVPGGGRGLEGIRERSSAAGGTTWIGPHEGRFIVDVRLPWGEPA